MGRWQRLIAACLLGVVGCATRQLAPDPPDPFFGTPTPGEPANPGKDAPVKPAPPPVETPTSTAALATASGVSLGAPRTIAPKPNTSNTQPITRTAATEEKEKAGPPTYEQLQARLKSRGVAWQQLQCMGDDRWHFICAIPNPANPNDRENYETTRAGNLGLNAMIAVLEQIDRDRSAPGGVEASQR